MVVVDTYVWISHFRKPDPRLIEALEARTIMTHSAILGELAAGSLKNRSKILGDMKMIPRVRELPADEVLDFLERAHLYGRGLGWVDLQILASCLSQRCHLITDDRRLGQAFEDLGPG